MTDHVTWWTPAGWIQAAEPDFYRAHREGDAKHHWTEFYPLSMEVGPGSPHPRVDIRHGDDHLLVIIHDECMWLCRFFVAEEHYPQFVMQCLPTLVQTFGPINRRLRS